MTPIFFKRFREVIGRQSNIIWGKISILQIPIPVIIAADYHMQYMFGTMSEK